MKIDQLAYFIETAKYQHIGKASQVLAISPSAISHSITSLEEELGVKLFEKNGKNIILTEEGKVFLERVEPILSELHHLKHDISNKDVAYRGYFKIANAHQIGPKIVAPICFDMQEAHPELQFEIQTFRSALVLKEVLNRQVDLGICFSPQEHPDIFYKTLREGKMYVVVRKNHPILKKRISERVGHLNTLTCVMAKSSQGIQVCESHPVFNQLGILQNISAVCDNYEVAFQKVIRSDAWGYMPDWAIKELGDEIVPLKLSQEWKTSYSVKAIWHRKQPLNRGLEEVLKKLEESFK
jgi:DNA-binding transcriptional LysR family regulator